MNYYKKNAIMDKNELIKSTLKAFLKHIKGVYNG